MIRNKLFKRSLGTAAVCAAAALLAATPTAAQPPETCGPGRHWIDDCISTCPYCGSPCNGSVVDTMDLSVAFIEIDLLPIDGVGDRAFHVSGTTEVERWGACDGPGNFGEGSPDGHIDVIDTEIIAMELAGNGITVTAGEGLGAKPLAPSTGVIVEHTGEHPEFPEPPGPDPELGDSYFHIYMEIELEDGSRLYNHLEDPFLVKAVIREVPPYVTLYVHPLPEPIPLWDDPDDGKLVGQLINAWHNTEITLDAFTATSFDGRHGGTSVEEKAGSADAVLLRWRTGYEMDNLGFNVYREEGGLMHRLNPSLVAGSALAAGAGTNLTAGRSYTWWDPLSAAERSVQYWLEEVDLNGDRTWHGPITPVSLAEATSSDYQPEVGRLDPGTANAVLMSELGRDAAGPASTAATRAVPRRAVPRKADPERTAMQWELAAGPAVKLAVREEGWYRVEQADLLAAGLDQDVDPRFLRLFADGAEQPILVRGEDDGRLDPADAVEFYGLGLDTAWTDSRIYWLVTGSELGRRIETSAGSRPAGPGPTSFRHTVELRERELYFGGLSNGDRENFFGKLVAPNSPLEQTLTLEHLDPGATENAVLEVVLQGVTPRPHHVDVELNGEAVGTTLFTGQIREVTRIEVANSRLKDGANVVTLTARGRGGDFSLVDHIRLSYWHTYTAAADALRFTVPDARRVRIDGFRSPDVRVFDVTDPAAVLAVRSVRERTPHGTWAVAVRAAGRGERTLLAVGPGAVRQVASMVPNDPSDWHRADREAELVIVGHASLLPAVEPLRERRESQGWKVAMVDVEDLYDELHFGVKSPHAIRAFLAHAVSAWRTPPGYLLLVGDASLDPRDYRHSGKADLVPTQFVATRQFDSASDDWFADLDGDALAELAVGRLPVRSREETAAVVAKLIAYEDADPAASWTRDVLLVADNNDYAFDFELASAAAEDALPAGLNVERIYLGRSGLKAARSRLLDRLNQGQLLVNYVGHGGVENWAGERLLRTADVAALRNGARLPFVVAMNCSNGYFNSIFEDSLAAALITAPEGGAVAVWASSSMTLPDRQLVLDHLLVERLFAGPTPTLGEATLRAKAAVSDPDLRRTWILFGDPTLRLKR